jgi:GT2 family glycosyltransferase
LKGGTRETARLCAEKKKPCVLIGAAEPDTQAAAERACRFVREHGIHVLNVAGPRESEWRQGYDFARTVVTGMVTLLSPLEANSGDKSLASPVLSFIIPAHNEEHELPQTLRAVQTAAEISTRTYEIIVVDDASTDATAEIARQFGARVIPVNFRQIAAVRNAGARAATGDVFFFVDADTCIAPSHLTAGLKALADGSSGGSARVALDSDVPLWARVFLRLFIALYFASNLGVGAFLFMRRETFLAAGGFDEQYFAGEEVYLSLALKKLGRFRILSEPIITSARKMRMHSGRLVLKQFLWITFGGKRALRKREKLQLWYDGKREGNLA